MLTIDIASLKDGAHKFIIETGADSVGLDPEDFHDVRVDVLANLYNRRFLLDIRVMSIARLECDRTLVIFEKELRGEYRMLFVPEGTSVGEEGDHDEVGFYDPSEPRLNITDVVHDTIKLSVPVRKIAPEAEGADFPTSFGEPGEEEIDPRWAVLRKLGDSDKNK